MSACGKWLVLAGCLLVTYPRLAAAEVKTVCTITVNSPDEKETLRRHLPASEYRFVELVERGRPDWLAAACRERVRCDALVISGHFDGGTEFYTDRLDASESLPVDELERVSCSDTCPGLFSQLKAVYLFGCNTLNAEAMHIASAEITRSLVRAGHSPADAERLAAWLSQRYGQSNRDRMRHIFKDVPVLYGFSSKAPLGRVAGPMLDRYLQTAGPDEIAKGRVSAGLIGLFAPSSMVVASGVTDADPHIGFRSDVCQFADERRTHAQKAAFVHEVLSREPAEARMFLDHLERFTVSLGPAQRQAPEMAAALERIARDGTARRKYLEFARDADEPAVQARMMALAREFGWLSAAEEESELMQMLASRMRRDAIGPAEVALACSRTSPSGVSATARAVPAAAARSGSLAHAAVVACLGSMEARTRVIDALASPRDDDVAIAEVYLRHRPLADAAELRDVAARIARMSATDAQTRALAALAQQRVSDPETLGELARLFPRAKSLQVQRAIAGVLIRADYRLLETDDLARSLRQHRLKSPAGEDVIDVLIRRLQTSS